jgi:hypothetical protein
MQKKDSHRPTGPVQTQDFVYRDNVRDKVPYCNFPVFERAVDIDGNNTFGIKYVEILPGGYMIHIRAKDMECILPLPYYLLGKKKLFRELGPEDMRKVAGSVFSDEANVEMLMYELEKLKGLAIAVLDRENQESGSHDLLEASL